MMSREMILFFYSRSSVFLQRVHHIPLVPPYRGCFAHQNHSTVGTKQLHFAFTVVTPLNEVRVALSAMYCTRLRTSAPQERIQPMCNTCQNRYCGRTLRQYEPTSYNNLSQIRCRQQTSRQYKISPTLAVLGVTELDLGTTARAAHSFVKKWKT